jgi:hypothetical protein
LAPELDGSTLHDVGTIGLPSLRVCERPSPGRLRKLTVYIFDPGSRHEGGERDIVHVGLELCNGSPTVALLVHS